MNITTDSQVAAPTRAAERDAAPEPLTSLIHRVIETHHVFTREELDRGSKLFEMVVKAHGDKHPELIEMKAVFEGLRDELVPHMMKEERVLFPYICALEQAAERGERSVRAPFGTVQNPVRMMNYEHDSAGAALDSLRSLSKGYQLPDDACPSFGALFTSLLALEDDLRRHIEVESGVMFPRAIDLEASLGRLARLAAELHPRPPLWRLRAGGGG